MTRANRDEPSAPEQVAAVLAQLGIEAARITDGMARADDRAGTEDE